MKFQEFFQNYIHDKELGEIRARKIKTEKKPIKNPSLFIVLFSS